jgi:hypothetical protein
VQGAEKKKCLAPAWHRPRGYNASVRKKAGSEMLRRAALFGRTVAVGEFGRTRAEMLRFVAVRALYVPDNAASWSGERLRLDHHQRATSSVALDNPIVLHRLHLPSDRFTFRFESARFSGRRLFFFCSFVLTFMR